MGRTVLTTVSVLLGFLLVPPLWELTSMSQRHYHEGELGTLRYRCAASTVLHVRLSLTPLAAGKQSPRPRSTQSPRRPACC